MKKTKQLNPDNWVLDGSLESVAKIADYVNDLPPVVVSIPDWVFNGDVFRSDMFEMLAYPILAEFNLRIYGFIVNFDMEDPFGDEENFYIKRLSNRKMKELLNTIVWSYIPHEYHKNVFKWFKDRMTEVNVMMDNHRQQFVASDCVEV